MSLRTWIFRRSTTIESTTSRFLLLLSTFDYVDTRFVSCLSSLIGYIDHEMHHREYARQATARALDRLQRGEIPSWDVGTPVRLRMRFTSPTHVAILQSIPGVSREDGYTVTYRADDADEAYRLIRLMYRFVRE